MSNQLRAAIIAVAQSAFPVLILIGIDLSDTAIAAIMLVITNTITLLALIFPGAAGPTPLEAVAAASYDQLSQDEVTDIRDLLSEQRAKLHDSAWVEMNAEA